DGQRYFGGVRLSLSGEAPELEASGVISNWSPEGIPISISYANTSAEEQAIGFAISATLNGLPSRYDTKGMVVAPGESRSLSALVVPPIEEGWSSELWYYGPRNAHGEAHQS